MKLELRYRTFDQLLSSVLSDFKTYDQEGQIDPQDLIKIAQKINTQLGVKIFQNKQKILTIEKGRVRLPNDFFKLNLAYICTEKIFISQNMQGIQTEDVILPSNCNNPGPIPCHTFNTTCREGSVRLTECGKEYHVIQYFKTQTVTYKHLRKLKITDGSGLTDDCPNKNFYVEEEGYIKDGWLYVNFDKGTLYINYISQMEDEDDNLLVLDDNIINEYYEYALKERILENLLIEGEDVVRKLEYIAKKRSKAYIEAKTRSGMYEFDELQEIWERNRKVMYRKYYYQFI